MRFKPYQITPGPSQVRQINKVLPYSITPINDITSWKAERQAIDAAWQAERDKRVHNVQDALQSGKVDVEAALTLDAALKAEKASYDSLGKSKPGRFKANMERQAEYEADQANGFQLTPMEEQPTKLTLSQRLKAAAIKLWREAFDS